MPRFSLILSKTMKLEINLDSVDVKCIPDIPCMDDNECIVYDGKGDPTIHTDGAGFISENLAMQCPEFFLKDKNNVMLSLREVWMRVQWLRKFLASNDRNFLRC